MTFFMQILVILESSSAGYSVDADDHFVTKPGTLY